MRVLIIDDEKHIADTLVMILQQSGWEATAAYDGKLALQHVDTFHPKVVISDVILPGMNGIEVCMAIQSKYPACHIFLFSGQPATDELVSDARQRGFHWELLAKPIEPQELLDKLEPFATE
jgi:DNA-binding response OmpR family regulator